MLFPDRCHLENIMASVELAGSSTLNQNSFLPVSHITVLIITTVSVPF